MAEKIQEQLSGGPPRLLPVAKVSELTGLPTSSIRAFIGRGELTAIRLGRRLMISQAEYADWLRRNAIATHQGASGRAQSPRQ